MENNHQPRTNTDSVVYVRERHFNVLLNWSLGSFSLAEIYTKQFKSDSEMSNTTNVQYPFQDKYEEKKAT